MSSIFLIFYFRFYRVCPKLLARRILNAKTTSRADGIERSPCCELNATSEQVNQDISSLLSEGIQGDANILTELVKKGVQHILQEALEQEVTDHLGRGHYERHQGNELHRDYRNGYEPKYGEDGRGGGRSESSSTARRFEALCF